MNHYIPKRGDIMYVDFDPVLGHEQGGRRPALVISNSRYNAITKLCILSPITSVTKGYVFETALQGKKIKGSILTDQMRTIDWTTRNIQYIESIHPEIMDEVYEKQTLIISS